MTTATQLAVFCIAATLITSFIYFLILDMIKSDKNEKTRHHLINLYLWRKISGFVILGIIPALAAGIFFNITPDKAGLVFGETSRLWPWIAGASLFFITLNIFNSKNPDIRAMYPELRLKKWNATGLAIAIGGWILYLMAYEYLFRGLLLFSCLEAFGLWPSITINLALYAALHLPKGTKEAIAAIPFGALICYLTIESGSLFPAIFIHSLQAISAEIFCIFRNPGMNFYFSKSNQP
jgi:membrane protease YdiL (CAAX protease family)